MTILGKKSVDSFTNEAKSALMLFGSILKIPYPTGSVQTIREHMQLKFEYPRKVNANCYECKLFQFFPAFILTQE